MRYYRHCRSIQRLFLGFFSLMVMVILAAGLTACGFPAGGALMDVGSLSVAVETEDSAGSRSISPSIYIFSGTGPDGDTFSVAINESTAGVEDLRAGEWSVRVDGMDENGSVVLTGETTVTLEPNDVTPVYIVLTPIDGTGSIVASVAWNVLQTASPSAQITVTAADGESETCSLTITGSGTAEGTVGDLPVGYYHVALQLLDSGVSVTGCAWTVMILNGSAVEVAAQFEDLNKVGECIEITEETFTLAWDDDAESGTTEEYRIYVRNHGEEDWNYLCTLDATDEPQLTVNTDILSYGTYEFAVSAVADGSESDFHTSLDDSAQPTWGWYVDWIGS